jgi:hypothetical protein
MEVNDMSPIQGIVNEITLDNFENILNELNLEEIMDEENIARITKEESAGSIVLRLETKNQIMVMFTIPKKVTEIKSGIGG